MATNCFEKDNTNILLKLLHNVNNQKNEMQ